MCIRVLKFMAAIALAASITIGNAQSAETKHPLISTTGTSVDQIRFIMPRGYDGLVALLSPCHSMVEVQTVLNKENIAFRRERVILNGVQYTSIGRLKSLPAGEPFMFELGGVGYINSLIPRSPNLPRQSLKGYVEGIESVGVSQPLGQPIDPVSRRALPGRVVLVDMIRVRPISNEVTRRGLLAGKTLNDYEKVIKDDHQPYLRGFAKWRISRDVEKRMARTQSNGIIAIRTNTDLIFAMIVQDS